MPIQEPTDKELCAEIEELTDAKKWVAHHIFLLKNYSDVPKSSPKIIFDELKEMKEKFEWQIDNLKSHLRGEP